jgi:hypothetical protein
MGGNSIGSGGGSRRISTPTPSPRESKLDRVLSEMKELSPSERKSAISALKKAGMTDLAKALEALVPSGSRPAERPAAPSGGGKR